MIDFRDPKASDKVRDALKEADRQGRLHVIAAQTGIAGGEAALRKIMNSSGEIPTMDRGVIGIYLLS